jgi:hypothetical protein
MGRTSLEADTSKDLFEGISGSGFWLMVQKIKKQKRWYSPASL